MVKKEEGGVEGGGDSRAGVEGGVYVSYNNKFCALNINVIVLFREAK